ncbi:MAG: NADH-quinone oxidoreductase subunit M [Gemmatimonadota bacterium]|nr:NADH-quinone oxidoreductase subunit M [Gemmatimonadota bacterium]
MTLTLAILVPLAGAALVLALPTARASVLRTVAVLIAAVPLVLSVVAWARFRGTGGFEQLEAVRWIPTLGARYVVGVDGFSLPLVAMTALLFLAAIVYPVDLRDRPKAYFALFLFLESVSLGVFLALDLLLFYVFWDLSLVGMYFLIGVWGHGEAARRAALKFFLYTLAGSLVMLLAILALYLHAAPRTFDMARLIAARPLDGAAAMLTFLGFAFAFAVKSPLVPFHTWLPPAHVDAPAPASAILAGVLLKMGTYGFVRILLQMMPATFARLALPLGVLAVVSIVYGALVALAQQHLKRRIAYTSVNHMGYAVLGIAAAAALGTDATSTLGNARALALTGATVEMVAHGLITGALFLITGSIWLRAETYEIAELGGLARKAPALTGLTALAAFASLGLPGLAGFVAELQIFLGTFAVYPWLAAIALLGILITAALFLNLLQRVFLGTLPDRWSGWRDLGAVEIASLTLLLAFVVLVGVAPAWLLTVIDSAARSVIGSLVGHALTGR